MANIAREERERREAERIQGIFRDICKREANGKNVKEKGMKASTSKKTGENLPALSGRKYKDYYPNVPINEDNFKMAYANLDPDNVFYKCRKMLPKEWFVSRAGEVIEIDGNNGYWKHTNKQYREQRQAIEDRIYNGIKDVSGDKVRVFDKQYLRPKTNSKTISSYALTGVVYGARVLGEVAENELKLFGLDCFRGDRGDLSIQAHHIRGYFADDNKTPEENMLYNNNPDNILFLTSRVHKAIKDFIISMNNKEDAKHIVESLGNTIEKEFENSNKYIVIFPYLRTETGENIDYEDYNITVGEFGKGEGEKISILAKDIPYADIEVYNKPEEIKGIKEVLDGYFVVPETGQVERALVRTGFILMLHYKDKNNEILRYFRYSQETIKKRNIVLMLRNEYNNPEDEDGNFIHIFYDTLFNAFEKGMKENNGKPVAKVSLIILEETIEIENLGADYSGEIDVYLSITQAAENPVR